MANADPPEPLGSDECREPTLEDLVKLCRALNEAGAQYVVVGGFAIRAAGYARNTMDVDLLIETSLDNESRVIQALMTLPDQAAREIKPGEIAGFGVVRVADEIMVDLMKSGCGVPYSDAIQDAIHREIGGVKIPFASPLTLWRMKQTLREKDIPDRLFLRKLLESQGVHVEEKTSAAAKQPQGWRAWLIRILGGRN